MYRLLACKRHASGKSTKAADVSLQVQHVQHVVVLSRWRAVRVFCLNFASAMENPYSAPAADFTASLDDAQTTMPAFAALRGRIGRARYLAYTILPSFALMLAAALLEGALAQRFPAIQMLPVLTYIPITGLLLVMGVRRLHDMNLSGWLALLGLIPIVNLILWLGLLAAPSTAGANRHGPAPGPNTTGVLIAAWSGPLAVVLSIVYAAVVLWPMLSSMKK